MPAPAAAATRLQGSEGVSGEGRQRGVSGEGVSKARLRNRLQAPLPPQHLHAQCALLHSRLPAPRRASAAPTLAFRVQARHQEHAIWRLPQTVQAIGSPVLQGDALQRRRECAGQQHGCRPNIVRLHRPDAQAAMGQVVRLKKLLNQCCRRCLRLESGKGGGLQGERRQRRRRRRRRRGIGKLGLLFTSLSAAVAAAAACSRRTGPKAQCRRLHACGAACKGCAR